MKRRRIEGEVRGRGGGRSRRRGEKKTEWEAGGGIDR